MLRNQFILPDCKAYLCGHSLGPLHVSSVENIKQAMDAFSNYGVQGWNKSQWIELPYKLAGKLASILGAKADEVIVADSSVVNLYKVLKAALKIQKKRRLILTNNSNFPADLYIAQDIEKFDGIPLKTVNTEHLMESLTDEVAVLMLTHTDYRDASVFDMQQINALAHQHGIITVWDLSHSVGIVPLHLDAANADFAVGCTYKYLSGGPGSPAFIYANRRYHSLMESPIQGWMGHARPFSFEEAYQADGIRKFLGGTPSILSMKALEAALDCFTPQFIEAIYNQTMLRGETLIHSLKMLELDVYSPTLRGGHIAFCSTEGYAISRALIERGFICDFRAPELVRICINPAYVSEDDIHLFLQELRLIIEQKKYLEFAAEEVMVP